MRRCFRLLTTGALDPASNMAMDEALFLAFEPETSAPVVRFYEWDRVCVSTGAFQAPETIEAALHGFGGGVPVVRRPTGGGLLVHGGELTYSLVCSPRDIAAGTTVSDSFKAACGFLTAFYRALGFSPVFAGDAPGYERARRPGYIFCADSHEKYDILVGGRKLGGNAQKRRPGVVLQHGSIPLYRINVPRCCLEDLMPVVPERAVLARMLADAVAATFGVRRMPAELTAAEQRLFDTLREEKYAGGNAGLPHQEAGMA